MKFLTLRDHLPTKNELVSALTLDQRNHFIQTIHNLKYCQHNIATTVVYEIQCYLIVKIQKFNHFNMQAEKFK